MNEAKEIIIFDTTLRDGEQAPGCSMTLGEKLRIAHALKELNVNVIEAGFAAASPGDFESVKAIASEIEGPTICSLARYRAREQIVGPSISLAIALTDSKSPGEAAANPASITFTLSSLSA